MTSPEYVLWLMPPPDQYQRFAALIDRLSQRFGTPRFEPHITLSSTADMTETAVVAHTEELARTLPPVPVRLDGAGYTDTYFRCLFLRAVETPELVAAHRRAREHFGQSAASDFMPHLSLVYGEIKATEKEKAIDEEIAGRFPAAFVADRLVLCSAEGAPNAWRTIGPFLLGLTPSELL